MTQPTHLIVFMSDNHARSFMGCAGHPMVRTPALDRIAGEGARFANAYCASALCCPSRAAIATGRHPHQTRYWDNALAYDGVVDSWHHRVRDAGRTVCAIGKLHFRSAADDNGFSEEIATMHIVDGKGSLASLLRATEQGVPRRRSHYALYEDSCPGEADYQAYDRQITAHAIDWIQRHRDDVAPWVLLVSYPSPHPPFKVPQRFWDQYPIDEAPLPVCWHGDTRPSHPADQYLAWMNHLEDGFDEEFIRRVIAGYCGLITHTDEQIARVLDTLDELALHERTRIIYTSDHGEAAGHHGILGKANLYEHSIGVPLLMSGPGITSGVVIEQLTSHVDLFPTICESVGVECAAADVDLPGRTLWPALKGDARDVCVLSQYHALGSRNSSFAIRCGDDKLIYHVDMPNQLFNLRADPSEKHDLAHAYESREIVQRLEQVLRSQLDPEQVNAMSKADQAAHMTRWGGPDAVRSAGMFSVSPVPGKSPQIERV